MFVEYRVGVLRPEDPLRFNGGGPARSLNSIAAARGMTPNIRVALAELNIKDPGKPLDYRSL